MQLTDNRFFLNFTFKRLLKLPHSIRPLFGDRRIPFERAGLPLSLPRKRRAEISEKVQPPRNITRMMRCASFLPLRSAPLLPGGSKKKIHV